MTSTNNDINIQLCYLNNKIEDIKSIFSKNHNDNSQKIELLSELSNINQNNISTIQSNLNFYDKTESDNIFATKNELINSISLDNYYSKTEMNSNIDISQENKIEISKSLIPKNNLEINLGSIDKKFKELYLSGNTLHLGDQEIKSTNEGIKINKLIIGDEQSGKLKLSVDNTNLKVEDDNNNIITNNLINDYTSLETLSQQNSQNMLEIQSNILLIQSTLNSNSVLSIYEEINVTVVNSKFLFNDSLTPPQIYKNKIYKFLQEDISNVNHPLLITNNENSLQMYQTISFGTPGNDDSYIIFSSQQNENIYFYCINHGIEMGSHYNPIYLESSTNEGTSSSTNEGTSSSNTTGNVIDGYISNGNVKVFDLQNNLLQETVTDDYGEFTLINANTPYKVEVEGGIDIATNEPNDILLSTIMLNDTDPLNITPITSMILDTFEIDNLDITEQNLSTVKNKLATKLNISEQNIYEDFIANNNIDVTKKALQFAQNLRVMNGLGFDINTENSKKVKKKIMEKILQNDISVLNDDTHINDVIDNIYTEISPNFSYKTKNKTNARRMIRKINNSYNSVSSTSNKKEDFQKLFRIGKGFKNNSGIDNTTRKIDHTKGNTETDLEDSLDTNINEINLESIFRIYKNDPLESPDTTSTSQQDTTSNNLPIQPYSKSYSLRFDPANTTYTQLLERKQLRSTNFEYLDISYDGTKIIYGSGDSRLVSISTQLYPIENPHYFWAYPHDKINLDISVNYVCMSGDANTFIAGYPKNLYLYKFIDSEWIKYNKSSFFNKINMSHAKLSYDGKVVIFTDWYAYSGITIFRYIDGIYIDESSVLDKGNSPDIEPEISYDGNTIAYTISKGSTDFVKVYRYINNVWIEIGSFENAYYFGLSRNGNTLLINPEKSYYSKVMVYSELNEEWNQKGRDIYLNNYSKFHPTFNPLISKMENIIISMRTQRIGTYNKYYVDFYYYNISTDRWSKFKTLDGKENNDKFGNVIKTSGDLSKIIITNDDSYSIYETDLYE